MEFSKHEMELFIVFPGLHSKNFFYKMFLIFTKEFRIDFQNRKWNDPNRKWNYLSYIQASDQKTSFTKCFSFKPRSSKLIFINGNGIIWTGNGIIFPNLRPLMKKFLLQKVSHSYQGVQNWFSKQEIKSSKREMELFIKKLLQNVSNFHQRIQIDFQNMKWN